jgi:hypothetical protein
MGLGWDSVLKIGAFGACLMVAILVISFFVGISHDLFWFSLQLILAILFVMVILVSWRALKKVATEG